MDIIENKPEQERKRFCQHCGTKINYDAVVCTSCGRQVGELRGNNQQVIINHTVTNGTGKQKNKWISVLLCLFLGYLGIHRFYEGKIGTGILYFLTGGIFGIGMLIDFIILLFKPNPYYV
ncbi:NINE protein [Pullulanibacillus sp. KACC 23026]|uniref:TM2 domain-containing protein n=1 Tax=Pullulanibacillus sp. KACC 23026 TaxID=3028315 RepID=UPI0023B10D9C|nr:NINE protein [Pullulanibacillus sp. KACC 23026]WEG14025.1 NINE protein [Pullulanibacillus sp. KACC 23026]